MPRHSCLLLGFLSCRRFIFNWAHRGVGLSSLILAGRISFELFFLYFLTDFGFWIEKPLQDESSLRIMNHYSTSCKLLWYVAYSTQQWWLCFLVFVFLIQTWMTRPCTLWLFTVWAWLLWSCLSFTSPSRRKQRRRVSAPWETKMLVSKRVTPELKICRRLTNIT